tara:strand:+ start:113 stop:1000 length:888 start_codon:yes stop_codon:yes gene_type:complete
MFNIKRIIPKLDIKGPNLVKGICFEGNRVLGTANYFSDLYSEEGADEIFFQDTVASLYQRNNLHDILKNSATKVKIPITVAGGIRSLEDINNVLRAGADKVAINTAAIKDLSFIKDASRKFGSQCIVASLEIKKMNEFYEPWYDYGRENSGKILEEWCEKLLEAGIGEIFLSSVDRDGTGEDFDHLLIEKVMKISNVPIIVCSGAGSKENVLNLFKKYDCDGVGIGSLFHYNYLKKVETKFMSYDSDDLRMGKQIDSGNIDFIKKGYGGFKEIQVEPCSIKELKNYLKNNGVYIR